MQNHSRTTEFRRDHRARALLKTLALRLCDQRFFFFFGGGVGEGRGPKNFFKVLPILLIAVGVGVGFALRAEERPALRNLNASLTGACSVIVTVSLRFG